MSFDFPQGANRIRRVLLLTTDPSSESLNLFTSCTRELGQVAELICPNQTSSLHFNEGDIVFLFGDAYDDSSTQIIRNLSLRYKKFSIIGVAHRQEFTSLNVNCSDLIDDIIILPMEQNDLRQRIATILQHVSETDLLKNKMFAQCGLEMFVGAAENFRSVLRHLRSASDSDANVMITGETGTGKELFARAIHYLGQRSTKPFIPVNCGAIPEALFENEFFGHSRGAFTGASDCKEGLINEAEGGTLFLDEINTLSAVSQVKLLRFLENKQYRALGSPKNVTSNVRIVTASNINLDNAVQANEFRQDLLYRINVLPFHLPPLRDRSGDIPLLAQHFLEVFAEANNRGPMYFSADAIQKLSSYSWPGNIRELQHTIERIVLLSCSNLVKAKHFELDQGNLSELKSYDAAKKLALATFEKNYVLSILKENHWNVTKSAEYARKDRRTLQRLMKKHGISTAT